MKAFFSFLFLVVSLNSQAQENCQHLDDRCDYYNCLEKPLLCGDHQSLRGVGKKYCKIYFDQYLDFSKKGQRFIDKAFDCQIKALETMDSFFSCPQLKAKIMDNYVNCYYEHGYCELSGKDKSRVFAALGFPLVPIEIITAGLELLQKCSEKK